MANTFQPEFREIGRICGMNVSVNTNYSIIVVVLDDSAPCCRPKQSVCWARFDVQ